MVEYIKSILLYKENSPMLFSSFYFWGFFLFIYVFYCLIYRKNKWRNIYLFAISLFFYYKSGGYFFSLLIFSTIMDYSLGRWIGSGESKIKRKLFVTISVIINLSLLSYFKYSYFFIDTINQIFHTNLHVVNVLAVWTNSVSGSHFDATDIILPVGISFYIFQSLSYIIDVYRRKIAPVKNIIDFGFFITFFPQLVAGPIVRATEFIPQLYQDYKLTSQQFGHAVFLIIGGLIKKIVISDYISLNFVDRIFENPLSYTGFENLMGAYGYSIQIYCDFSGYTDIAIGVALLLGFTLPLNFNSPYKAVNITEFWRRWHISLSTWLKDYLYISLGGNRKGKIRTYFNLFLTMLLGGLWHGANVKFIIWGGLHGAGLAAHKIWLKISPFRNIETRKAYIRSTFRIAGIIITFHFVVLTWIYFRASNMESVNIIFYKIFYDFQWRSILEIIVAYKITFALMSFAFLIHWLPSSWKEFYRGTFIKSPVYIKVVFVVLMVIIIYQTKSSALQPFIYFQF